jgi:hypothetical protein
MDDGYRRAKPTHHELKIWPVFFEAINGGWKQFEIRKDDRSPCFMVGDLVTLREWNQSGEGYTGAQLGPFVIGYIERGGSIVPEGFCVFTLVAPELSR